MKYFLYMGPEPQITQISLIHLRYPRNPWLFLTSVFSAIRGCFLRHKHQYFMLILCVCKQIYANYYTNGR